MANFSGRRFVFRIVQRQINNLYKPINDNYFEKVKHVVKTEGDTIIILTQKCETTLTSKVL